MADPEPTAGERAEGCVRLRLHAALSDKSLLLDLENFDARTAKLGDIELEGDAGGAERTAEEHIRKRAQIGFVVPKARLLADLNAQGIDMAAAQRALAALIRQREFEEVAQGKKVKRLR